MILQVNELDGHSVRIVPCNHNGRVIPCQCSLVGLLIHGGRITVLCLCSRDFQFRGQAGHGVLGRLTDVANSNTLYQMRMHAAAPALWAGVNGNS